MKKSTLALLVAGALIAGPAVAYEKGDWLVRGGLTTVAPDDSSTDILVGGSNSLPEVGVVGGVSVGNDTQLGLNIAYFFADKWNVEVLAATPFKHDIDFALGNLATTKHLPPTVTANYFFADPAAKFQPYAGVGFNYTVFFDEEFNGATVDAVQAATTGTTLPAGAEISNLDLDASFGFSAQVGFDYELTKRMFLNASVRYIDIETEASFDVEGLGNVGAVEKVTIDPWVYTLSLGYRF
ncbi:outer membrane protein OmpW [Alteromonas sediminis]|uniref:Outer membrane protein OmpW n=1 Tax=Alteromonas sediminis TaxID=2259342 RepID=A0A3N5YC60_9ALTE|nr:OmpW family outer membrane protein [Alteromonas sediminis]RPJ66805.1 outer membrane protein OmpW [Alteromonas sediminis]